MRRVLAAGCLLAFAAAAARGEGSEPWPNPAHRERLGHIRAASAALAASAADRREEASALESARESAAAGGFQGILDEVVPDGDFSSDLSRAEPGHEFSICYRIQFRDSGDGEFQDYRGKGTQCVTVVPDLVAVDPYWSAHFQEDGRLMTRMESFYIFHFRVIGRTLRWHQIFQEMTWVKGNPPFGREMDLVGHEEHELDAGGSEVSTRVIGAREFRLNVGFFSRPAAKVQDD